MRRLTLLFVSALSVFGIMAGAATSASAAAVLDQNSAGSGGGIWFGLIDGTQFYRQSFTAGASGPLSKIVLTLMKSGSPGALAVSVSAADVQGNPVGPILATTTIEATAVGAWPGSNVPANFASPVSVVTGNSYVVSITCAGCTNGGGDFAWFAATDNPYAGGVANDWYFGTVSSRDFQIATYVGLDALVSSAGASPEDILQQVGMPSSGSCADVDAPGLNWAGVASGGWMPSWAQWRNAGSGGAICGRTLYYALSGAWAIRS